VAAIVTAGLPGLATLCSGQLEWSWTNAPPNTPRLIVSQVVRWPTPEIAGRAMAHLAQFEEAGTGTSLTPTAGDAGLGDESTTFTSTNAFVEGRLGGTAAAIGWRRGEVTAFVLVAGAPIPAASTRAPALARIVDRRIVTPRADAAQAVDDRFVAIDDPALAIDVWWLGDPWSGAPGLGALTVSQTFAPRGVGSGPGSAAEVAYAVPGRPFSSAVSVMTWTPAAWRRFSASRLGRAIEQVTCATRERVRLPLGQATITSIPEPGGTPRPPTDGCADPGAGERAWAVATLEGAVVTVNLPICTSCFGRGPPEDPYDSRAGMDAVVHALRPRG